jgi:hypothetical protein
MRCCEQGLEWMSCEFGGWYRTLKLYSLWRRDFLPVSAVWLTYPSRQSRQTCRIYKLLHLNFRFGTIPKGCEFTRFVEFEENCERNFFYVLGPGTVPTPWTRTSATSSLRNGCWSLSRRSLYRISVRRPTGNPNTFPLNKQMQAAS